MCLLFSAPVTFINSSMISFVLLVLLSERQYCCNGGMFFFQASVLFWKVGWSWHESFIYLPSSPKKFRAGLKTRGILSIKIPLFFFCYCFTHGCRWLFFFFQIIIQATYLWIHRLSILLKMSVIWPVVIYKMSVIWPVVIYIYIYIYVCVCVILWCVMYCTHACGANFGLKKMSGFWGKRVTALISGHFVFRSFYRFL